MTEKEVNFPPNLFNTWLEYRQLVHDQSRAEVIREFNSKLDRKYANNIAYEWKKQNASLSENIIKEIIYPELPDLFRWYFERNNYDSSAVDFEKLANDFRPPIKLS